jgi:hypothetical protein
MLKFLLSRFRHRARPNKPALGEVLCLQWVRDPLSHPVLDSMSERELGDLPFRR